MILDTNGLSALADGDVTLEPILRQATSISLPVIVLGEYRYGIRQSRHRARFQRMTCGLRPWLASIAYRYSAATGISISCPA